MGWHAFFGEDAVDFLAVSVCQAPVNSGDILFQLALVAHAHEANGHRRMAQHPSQRQLGD